MTITSFNDREDQALRSVPWRARVVYLQGIRRHMDYTTGWSGTRRVLSYQFFFELLESTEHSTSPDPGVSKDGLRAIFKMLERAGLVEWPRGKTKQRGVFFKCLLADTDKSVQNKDALKTHRQDALKTHPQDAPSASRQDAPEKPHCNAGSSGEDALKTHPQDAPPVYRQDAPPVYPQDAPPPVSGTTKDKNQYLVRTPERSAQDSDHADPTDSDPQEPTPAKPNPKPTRKAERFDEWWAQYPKKVARKTCREKWMAKNLDAMADTLLRDVMTRSAEDRKWRDGYVPNPLTYLNQERWEDDIERAAPARSNGAGRPRGAEGNDETIRRWVENFAEDER